MTLVAKKEVNSLIKELIFKIGSEYLHVKASQVVNTFELEWSRLNSAQVKSLIKYAGFTIL